VPVDEGGPSVIENARAACKPCNQATSYFRRVERAGPASEVPSAADLDGFVGGCASSQGGPHDLSKWGGPRQCWGQPGHASRDWGSPSDPPDFATQLGPPADGDGDTTPLIV